jgi:branched-chain amino acid transport system substrate-binding protein
VRLAALVGGALVVVLGGCTAPSGSTVTVAGKRLTVYLSAPASATQEQPGQDIIAAERLAFQQLGGSAGQYTLSLRTLGDQKVSNNARTAIQDPSAIAYLGELTPGRSAESIGITNAEDLLQVSPGDTALELTKPSAAVSGAPNRYLESLKAYGRTFARVVPNSAAEARAQVRGMRSLGVHKLFVSDDGSQYGRAIALAVRQAATPSLSVMGSAAGADGAFYGGASAQTAAAFFHRVAASAPRARLFAPSGLAGSRSVASLSAQVHNLYVSLPGFLPDRLPSAARRSFLGPFIRTYHHRPATEAIFGYEAMAAVLTVLRQEAQQAGDRSRVVHQFFAIHNRSSALGTYSIDASGDTSIAPYVFGRVSAGRLVPFRALSAPG